MSSSTPSLVLYRIVVCFVGRRPTVLLVVDQLCDSCGGVASRLSNQRSSGETQDESTRQVRLLCVTERLLPEMLSPRGQRGLLAKVFSLGLGLVLM